MQEVQTGPLSGSSLGMGASRRTRRVLTALLLAGLAAVLVAVIDSQRDPSEFRDRTALPTCDSTEVRSDGTVPPAAAACLDAAINNGRGAELRVAMYTDEGDEISAYYRAWPSGGVEVFVDNTNDSYGTGG